MRQVSLCLLLRENKGNREILLAMKKRGFGQGRWNGVGGKIDPAKGDRGVWDSAVRETEEEIGVKPKNFKKVAIIDFHFPEVPKEKDYDQQVHVFLTRKWEGEPTESEEMAPKWFKIEEIPFDEMWDDDRYWLPYVLKNKKLKARFTFDKNDKIVEQVINFAKKLE